MCVVDHLWPLIYIYILCCSNRSLVVLSSQDNKVIRIFHHFLCFCAHCFSPYDVPWFSIFVVSTNWGSVGSWSCTIWLTTNDWNFSVFSSDRLPGVDLNHNMKKAFLNYICTFKCTFNYYWLQFLSPHWNYN